MKAYQDYHSFVGIFISHYAQLETLLRKIVRQRCGMDDERFEAVVGFPRSGQLRALAQKLVGMDNMPSEDRAMVDDAFQHLAIVTLLRDRVVHYGGSPILDDNVVLFSKGLDEWDNSDVVPQSDLWDAARDLNRVYIILATKVFSAGKPNPNGETALRLLQSWQYKRPQPPRNR